MLLPVTEQPPLVLIATLNASARVALARLVTRRGMTALACFDGAATLACAHAERQGLCGAILDPDLPSIDGAGVAHALMAETGLANTLILHGQAGAREAADRSQDCRELTQDDLARIDAWLRRLTPPRPSASSDARAVILAPR